MPNDLSRRTFFAGAATAAGALRVAAASDRVRLGLIGCGGRGKHLVNMARLALVRQSGPPLCAAGCCPRRRRQQYVVPCLA